MTTKEVAAILEEIAILLELAGENPFKARSYTSVARNLEQHGEDVETLVREKRLREVKGVGDAIEEKITELVENGRLEYYEDLKARFPDTLFELFRIPGLGAKRIKTLYDDLGIRSLGELEHACVEDRLSRLKGWGKKMQDKVREGIEFAKTQRGQHLYNTALAEAEGLRDWLAESGLVTRLEVAGSLRRCKEVVKDIDILATGAEAEALMDRFVTWERVARVTSHGGTKSSVVLESGMAADLRVVKDKEFPYALHHFTGSKEHNVGIRQRAKDRGLKLNEYGLFHEADDSLVECEDEAGIFAALDLPYIPPELREDMGELEAETLPELVTLDDLRGVIHCHSTYSDGKASVEQMARAAQDLGYGYLVISDHSQSAGYAGGLKPDDVAKQHKEIDALNEKLEGFRVFKGIESDIRVDGSLDYEDGVLETFDFVIASVHNKLDMTEDEATRRVVTAIENPRTAILAHPTGRLLLARQGYSLDFEKVFDACIANNTAIEINANCHRLDLDWRQVKRARDKGLWFSIGPDAHNVEGLRDVAYGVNMARKGWLTREPLINCLTAEELHAWRRSS